MTATYSTPSIPSTDSTFTHALQIPEILENVSSFLRNDKSSLFNASLVCKFWSTIFTARVWHTLDYPPLKSPEFVSNLRRHGSNVRSLEYTGAIDLNLIFEALPQLQSLSLTLVQSSNLDVIQQLVVSLPHLKALNINFWNKQNLKWLSILKNLHFLEELVFINDYDHIYKQPTVHLGGDYEVDSSASGSGISSGEEEEEAENIEYGLGNYNAEEEEEKEEEEEEEANDEEEAHSETNDTVESEEVEYGPVDDDESSSDTSEDAMASLAGSDYLGDFLVARASSLKILNLEGEGLSGFILFENWRKEGTLGLKNNLLPNPTIPLLALTELDISNIGINRPHFVVEALLLQSPNLENLNISSNFDRYWSRFNWSVLHSACLKLKSLNISQLDYIDNDQLVLVIKKCLGLRSIIAVSSNIADIVLDAIVERQLIMMDKVNVYSDRNQHIAQFLELDIAWCMEISQGAVQRVLEQVSSLESLKVSWCQQIKLSIFEAHWSCSNLRTLEVQGLDNQSNISLSEQSSTSENIMFERISGFRHLQRLVVGSNEIKISVMNGFDLVGGQRLPRLEYLELVAQEEYPLGIPELTVIKEGFPKLKRFHFGMGLVSPDMQSWLMVNRPDVKMEENKVYF